MKSKNLSEKILRSIRSNGFNYIELDSVIETNHIVQRSGESFRKLIFSFIDHTGNELCLRPDLTIASCLRYLDKKLKVKEKIYYSGEAYRKSQNRKDSIIINQIGSIKQNNNEPVLICILDSKYLKKYYETLNYLRENGINSEIYLDSSKNLKKQLTYADKKDCPVAVIIGESEFKENKFTLKNLRSSKENDQKTVSKESLINEIKKLIWKNP